MTLGLRTRKKSKAYFHIFVMSNGDFINYRGLVCLGLGKMLSLVLDLLICVKGMSMENELYTKTNPPITDPEVLISYSFVKMFGIYFYFQLVISRISFELTVTQSALFLKSRVWSKGVVLDIFHHIQS